MPVVGEPKTPVQMGQFLVPSNAKIISPTMWIAWELFSRNIVGPDETNTPTLYYITQEETSSLSFHKVMHPTMVAIPKYYYSTTKFTQSIDVFYFGGIDIDTGNLTNNVYKLNIYGYVTWTRSEIDDYFDISEEFIDVTGEKPEPRAFSHAFPTANGFGIIGGLDKEKRFNDLWLFDYATKT